MVAQLAKQTPPATRPPPQVPADVKGALADYLGRVSLWTRNELANKLSTSHAAPGVMLQATDSTDVFLITVNSTGTISATPVPLGQHG